MDRRYKVIKPLLSQLEQSINDYAEDGWKVVGFWQERYRDMENVEKAYATVLLEKPCESPTSTSKS